MNQKTLSGVNGAESQGPQTYLALHTLGWKAFQDLCAQVCEVVFGRAVSIYREAQDGGQDATFTSPKSGMSESCTVQCKFVSDPRRRLKAGDLVAEKSNIETLVSLGLAHRYCFITNMGVDAPIAAAIKAGLTSLGVVEPEIFGKEWITLKVRESAKLRALVPRIYGLGDLSIILDERRAEQTSALLGHLMPTLRTYVPTSAHRQAVRLLGENGIVLLTGAPATGKSMIAAILAATTLGSEGHQCFQLDGPGELSTFWNPNESGRFYWIDDAFGPSQLRMDYVDHWIAVMNKVRTAIAAGNRFVLTSRQHIWNAAKLKLGLRNHPKLADDTSVVNVGSLSPDERAQILYNHVKAGNQPSSFRTTLKPHLDELASANQLLPEVARRLGDRSYTTGIFSIPKDVVRFISEPKTFLKETLNELTDPQRAALTAIFLFRSRLPHHIGKDERLSISCDKFGVEMGDAINALKQLEGSFTTLKPDGSSKSWTFAHPTIADALADILRDRPDLLDLYVRGARVQELLGEIVCDGTSGVRDAVVVPESLNETVVERVLEMPDEPGLNRILFSFLASRASDTVVMEVVKRNPEILLRRHERYWRVRYDDRIALLARLNSMRLLPEQVRKDAAEWLERIVLDRQDASFLDQEEVLGLFTPSRLMQLSLLLYEKLGPSFVEEVDAIADDADLDLDPPDNFDDIKSYARSLESALSSIDDVAERISAIEAAIEEATKKVAQRKREAPVEWDGEDVVPKLVSASSGSRSIFADVDS